MPEPWTDPLGSVPDNIQVERSRCFLAPIIERIVSERPNGFGLIKCDGQLDPHHCVEQQRIKRRYPHGAYWVGDAWIRLLGPGRLVRVKGDPRHIPYKTLDDFLADRRNIVPVCRRHHDLLTSHAIKLSREDYPPSVHEFAAEYGFYHHPTQGWVAEVFACDGIDEAGY